MIASFSLFRRTSFDEYRGSLIMKKHVLAVGKRSSTVWFSATCTDLSETSCISRASSSLRNRSQIQRTRDLLQQPQLLQPRVRGLFNTHTISKLYAWTPRARTLVGGFSPPPPTKHVLAKRQEESDSPSSDQMLHLYRNYWGREEPCALEYTPQAYL